MKIKCKRDKSPPGKGGTAIVKAFAVQGEIAEMHVGVPEVDIRNMFLITRAQFSPKQRIGPCTLPSPRENPGDRARQPEAGCSGVSLVREWAGRGMASMMSTISMESMQLSAQVRHVAVTKHAGTEQKPVFAPREMSELGA